MHGSLERFLLFLVKVKDANGAVLFPLPLAFDQLSWDHERKTKKKKEKVRNIFPNINLLKKNLPSDLLLYKKIKVLFV